MESRLAQREPNPRPDRRGDYRVHLDESSKMQIRQFLFHITVITLFALPTIVLNGGKAALFLAQLTFMFSFTLLVLAYIGLR